MELAFDPHPNWRRNFEFTAAYTLKEPTYTLDPTIESNPRAIVEFTLDPVLHKYSWPPKDVA